MGVGVIQLSLHAGVLVIVAIGNVLAGVLCDSYRRQ